MILLNLQGIQGTVELFRPRTTPLPELSMQGTRLQVAPEKYSLRYQVSGTYVKDGRTEGEGTGTMVGRNFIAKFDHVSFDLNSGESAWRHATIWQNSIQLQTDSYVKTSHSLEVLNPHVTIRAERVPLLEAHAEKFSVVDGKGQLQGLRVLLLNRFNVNIGNVPVKIRAGESTDLNQVLRDVAEWKADSNSITNPEGVVIGEPKAGRFSAGGGVGFRWGEYPSYDFQFAYRLAGNSAAPADLRQPRVTQIDHTADYFSNVGVRDPAVLQTVFIPHTSVGYSAIFNRFYDDVPAPDMNSIPIALGIENVGKIGGGGYQFQVRGEKIDSRRDGKLTRATTFGTWLVNDRDLQRGLHFSTRLDGFATQVKGSDFSWVRPSAGLAARLTPWMRISGAGYYTQTAGERVLAVDSVTKGTEIAGRIDFLTVPMETGIAVRYEVENRRWGSIQLYWRQIIGAAETYVRFDPRSKGLGFGFKFRSEAVQSVFNSSRVVNVQRDAP